MKEMDMIKIEIKIKKTINLKIKILKKMYKIKMKNNLKEEVRKITITKMKIILKKNNKVIEGEINKIRCVFVRMQTSTRMSVYGTALFVGRDFQHSDFRDL